VADSDKYGSVHHSLRTKTGSSFTLWLPLLALTLLTACKREEIKVYYAPKDTATTPEMAAPETPGGNMAEATPPGHPGMSTGQAQIGFKTPDGWTEIPAGQMRVASFNIKGADGKTADVSVVPLPGLAGGDIANVNLWRQQVGLGPLTNEELKKLASPIEIGGQPAELFDQSGKNPSTGEPRGILGAIQFRDNTSWFFKVTGDPELLAQQKDTFVDFLKSVTFIAAAPAMSGNMPAGHPDVSMTPTPTSGPISHDGQPTWQVPGGWQEVSGGQFLIAKFLIAGDGGAQAAVNVSSSPGDGGGLLANVNRWRGQLGLAALPADGLEAAVSSIDVADGKANVVEMSGTDMRTSQPSAVIGVMVPQSSQTWFYKLMGDSKTVAAQKDAFIKFVQAVKY
jgi:hypothetical protein